MADATAQQMGLVPFDEFTSVVDHEVAKISSYAIQKAGKKFNHSA